MKPIAHQSPYALVVDDDAFIRMHAAGILEDADFRPLEAGDADQAVRLLELHHGQVQLLFTDVQMPGSRDGFALARHVASVWPHIGILIASGNVRPRPDDVPNRAVFISKPFTAEVVHHHVHKVLTPDQKPEPLRGR